MRPQLSPPESYPRVRFDLHVGLRMEKKLVGRVSGKGQGTVDAEPPVVRTTAFGIAIVHVFVCLFLLLPVRWVIPTSKRMVTKALCSTATLIFSGQCIPPKAQASGTQRPKCTADTFGIQAEKNSPMVLVTPAAHLRYPHLVCSLQGQEYPGLLGSLRRCLDH